MSGKYSGEMGQYGMTRITGTVIHHADFEESQDGNGGTSDGSNTYHPDIKKWVAVKILEGGTIDHNGTVMAAGDTPNSADIQVDGDIIWGPFKKIKLSAGKAYAYIGG